MQAGYVDIVYEIKKEAIKAQKRHARTNYYAVFHNADYLLYRFCAETRRLPVTTKKDIKFHWAMSLSSSALNLHPPTHLQHLAPFQELWKGVPLCCSDKCAAAINGQAVGALFTC